MDCDRMVALCHRCVVLFSEVWASLWVGVLRCNAPLGVGSRTEPLWCSLAQLQSPFEAVLLSLLSQMASMVEPPPGDAPMRDAAGAGESPQAGSELASAPATEQDGQSLWARLSPSQVSRLTVCMQVMQAWRHDSLTQQLRGLCQRRGSPAAMTWLVAASGLTGDTWTAGATSSASPHPQADTVLQHVSQVRARAGVLCTVFVHACGKLLSLPFMSPASVQDQRVLHSRPHLRFEGSSAHFRLLLTVIEMALHLLSEHLTGLTGIVALGGAAAATVSGAAVVAGVSAALPPTAGAPRSALVVQYLRALRQFAAAAGGGVAPTEDSATCSDTSARRLPGPVKAADLTFAACTAERVEELLVELQGL
uniref:Uncharacterized protein n=1 Tax=Alexandrium andersonii TaxID=327968 RepID=A0A7S2ANB8_9DINO